MRRPGFRKALTEAKKKPDKPADASLWYADMGHFYAWMSPTYVRDEMTEPMLYGYDQRAAQVKKAWFRSLAGAIVNDIIDRIMPAFGFKKK